MSAAAGIQAGFGDLLGVETLAAIRARAFTIVRISVGDADQDKTRQLAQEVIDAGLQPLCIIKRAEQMAVLPTGALVEAGNEPDISKFGWTQASYRKFASDCVDIAKVSGQRLYVGVVSNLNKRGFSFLKGLPWNDWPDTICCSVHRYPDGHSPENAHSGSKSRDDEIKKLKAIVGARPLAVTETGYSDGPGHFTPQEVADNLAWERRFFSRHGFEIVVAYQINDGPPSDPHPDAHYGFRQFETGEWKPSAAAFTGAV